MREGFDQRSGAHRQGNVHLNWTLLPDSQDTPGALVLDRRIPPTFEMDGVICACQRQTDPSGAGRE
jgi:hypothetical protein